MTPLKYKVRIDGQVLGPFSLETLQQMASLQAFNDSAWIALEGSEQWGRIRENVEFKNLLFPSAKKFQFKGKAFETVNTPEKEPLSVEEILQGNVTRAQSVEPPLSIEDRRPNRRRKDYVLSVIAINGGIALLSWFLPHTSIVRLLAGSFAIDIGLYWVLFHVSDRY